MEEPALNSANISSDFQFKYIPRKEFERIVMKVREKRAWRNFCSVTSAAGSNNDEYQRTTEAAEVKALSNDEVQSIVKSVNKEDISKRLGTVKAPMFGPARLLDASTLRKQQGYRKSSSESSSESASTIHIEEELNVMQPTPLENQIPVQIQINNEDEDEDDVVSDCSSVEDNESLRSEMLKLCHEIENSNGLASIDESWNEEPRKTEEKKVIYSDIVDKEFDFLFSRDDEDAIEVQTLPDVELERSDSSNDNNVWRPKMENQIRKSGRREKSEVKRNDDVFPSDVIIRKAREVGKLKRDVDEKPRETVEEKVRKKREPTRDEVKLTLSRITEYQSKICQYLEFLHEIIEDPPEIDDIVDLQKRQKRANEFSNRFARNHLYQIGRVAEEVRIMHDNPLDIASRVNFLFQVIMQAVQIYLKNVEMFIYNSYPDKLLVLIDFVINALKICLDRMVFDKRDKVIQEILKKCTDMKHFLEQNQFSFAKFAKIDEKRKKSLHSRSSFAYEVPNGTKLSMYEVPMTKQKRAPKNTQKSPYDAPRSRNLKSRSMAPSTSRPQNKTLKRSASNVSTMVQRVGQSGSDEVIKTVSEKPLEDPEVKNPNDHEIFQMMQNIAKDKIQEMLAPLLSQILSKNSEDSGKMAENLDLLKNLDLSGSSSKTRESLDPPVPRVTSDVKKQDLKPQTSSQESISKKSSSVSLKSHQTTLENPKSQDSKNVEKLQRISKNVTYLYVKSNDEGNPSLSQQSSDNPVFAEPQQDCADSPPSEQITSNPLTNKVVSSKVKPPNPLQIPKLSSALMKELKQQALADRLHYVKQMMENPLYVNEHCDEPWKLLSRISDKILDEMLHSVIAELDFGEKSFVEKFISSELRC